MLTLALLVAVLSDPVRAALGLALGLFVPRAWLALVLGLAVGAAFAASAPVWSPAPAWMHVAVGVLWAAVGVAVRAVGRAARSRRVQPQSVE
jgi:hypothetical protein